jgi:hypothetical protein
VLCLALACAGKALAAEEEPAVSVTATASRAEVSVGETFVVEVRGSGPAGTVWSFPQEAGNEEVDLRPVSETGGEARDPAPDTRRYVAAAFALAETRVPPVEVSYRLPDGTEGTVATSPIPLRILSVLPKDPDQQKLADIRGPAGLAVGRAFWVAAAALALAAGALAWWLVRRRRRRTEPAPEAAPDVAPDAAALAALERLAASGLLAGGEFRAFYIELAAIVKRYLEQRLGAPVLEMTSSEAVAFLKGHPHGGDFAPALRDLAGAADRVKFARGDALREEAERHVAGVRSMIAGIEERLCPAPAAGAERVA